MAKVTNISTGARGIRDESHRLVMIERGQSAEVELSASERKDAEETGYFAFGDGAAKKADEPKPLAKMNKDELLAVAKAENVQVADDATKAEIAEAIEKAREAK